MSSGPLVLVVLSGMFLSDILNYTSRTSERLSKCPTKSSAECAVLTQAIAGKVLNAIPGELRILSPSLIKTEVRMLEPASKGFNSQKSPEANSTHGRSVCRSSYQDLQTFSLPCILIFEQC